MEDRNLSKALEISAKLLAGEKVGQSKENFRLYEEYCTNSEVYDYLHLIMKKFNMELYEYNNTLFISAGENNSIFGFTNEELRKAMGLRVNKELFLCYMIIYCTLIEFYKDSSSFTYCDFVRVEDVIRAVDCGLMGAIDRSSGIVLDEVEENSFKMLALMWDELPATSAAEVQNMRAARNSKTGYVKLTFNFLVNQGLFAESEDRFYPTDRFKAMAENYYSDNRSRLYEIINGEAL